MITESTLFETGCFREGMPEETGDGDRQAGATSERPLNPLLTK